jgi:hypothetical protein
MCNLFAHTVIKRVAVELHTDTPYTSCRSATVGVVCMNTIDAYTRFAPWKCKDLYPQDELSRGILLHAIRLALINEGVIPEGHIAEVDEIELAYGMRTLVLVVGRPVGGRLFPRGFVSFWAYVDPVLYTIVLDAFGRKYYAWEWGTVEDQTILDCACRCVKALSAPVT